MGFGGGGSGSVAGSSDVALNSPVNQDVLTYDSSVSKWKNAVATGGVTSVAGKTGVVTLVKGDVGLGNVDNTADTAKPVSTATQTALNAKAPLASPTFTGTVTIPTGASITAPTGLVKADVGLGNVDNTADTAKPVSTATQTALNGKANTSHTHDSADIITGTINAARLPTSTTSITGVVQLATTSIATTGTDTTTAVTPAGLKAAITASFPTVVFVDDLSQIPPGTPVDTLVVVRSA